MPLCDGSVRPEAGIKRGEPPYCGPFRCFGHCPASRSKTYPHYDDHAGRANILLNARVDHAIRGDNARKRKKMCLFFLQRYIYSDTIVKQHKFNITLIGSDCFLAKRSLGFASLYVGEEFAWKQSRAAFSVRGFGRALFVK